MSMSEHVGILYEPSEFWKHHTHAEKRDLTSDIHGGSLVEVVAEAGKSQMEPAVLPSHQPDGD